MLYGWLVLRHTLFQEIRSGQTAIDYSCQLSKKIYMITSQNITHLTMCALIFWVSLQREIAKMSVSSCCLCLSPAPEDRTRRKLLHNTSYAGTKKILSELIHIPVEGLEASNPEAILCSKCESSLSNILKCQLKLSKLKDEVITQWRRASGQLPENHEESQLMELEPAVVLTEDQWSSSWLVHHQLHLLNNWNSQLHLLLHHQLVPAPASRTHHQSRFSYNYYRYDKTRDTSLLIGHYPSQRDVSYL